MSRYRATTRELLEQVRMYEGKMKDIYGMAFDGDSAETIAKKLKLDVETVKKVLGEEIALEKVERVPTGQYIVSYRTQDGTRKARVFDYRQHAHDFEKKLKSYGLKSEETLKEFNPDFGKDTKAGRTKETHADDKKTKDEDRIKSLENEIQRLKLELENEKNATVKPEPNPDTGEVPLTVGVAHKYLKDKQKKEVKKEEVELDENFSPAMVDKLKKAYAPLKGKRIPPEPLIKIFDKIDKNIPGLVQLYKADIPFVSTMAMSRLMLKHGLKPADIKKLKEETELTEYFATVHSNKKQIADFIKKNKSGIDYVDDDAGGNIEFEGKGAHELADKIKSKFGVRVTKESFEPIEDKTLDEMSLPSMMKPMTVKYTYTRNPDLFDKTLARTKTGKTMKNVGPKLKGVYVLRATGQQHIDFLQTLNSKGIMPTNKILGEELEEDTNKYITEKIKGLETKAKKSGMPYSILKKVYDRGMAAWKGGHRPGATQQQWAFARVNSFVTKSSGTWGKADKDLADKVRASKKEEIEESNFEITYTNPQFSKPKTMKIKARNEKEASSKFSSYGNPYKIQSVKKVQEELEETRQLTDPNKEMMVVKDGKVKVIDKTEFDKYKSKGYIAAEETENEACWSGYKQVGMKSKNGKQVPNCVPEELQEADLTDKQVKMVRKVADKLPKDDFKKRYGKDADNVKFGTATNIVKKKLNIDEYEGARALVDRLLKQEKGDE